MMYEESGLEAQFLQYLKDRPDLRREIQESIDYNAETYYLDLSLLKQENIQLFSKLISEFGLKYLELQNTFNLYCASLLDLSSEELHHNYQGNNSKMGSQFLGDKIEEERNMLNLSFKSCSALEIDLQNINSSLINKLVCFKGTVTKTTQVRPELVLGTFKCLECLSLIPNIPQQHTLTHPVRCSNHLCSNRSSFEPVCELSHFSDWQKIHVQQNTFTASQQTNLDKYDLSDNSNNTTGMPISMDLILRNNDLCERINPGSQMIFTGYPIVMAVHSGDSKLPSIKSYTELRGFLNNSPVGNSSGGVRKSLRSSGKELNYKLSFYCINAEPSITQFTNYPLLGSKQSLSHHTLKRTDLFNTNQNSLILMRGEVDLYNKLSEALFPSIFGHLNIKNAILLMLVGGCTLNSSNSKSFHTLTGSDNEADVENLCNEERDIRVRGDINVLLVGDPGTAKSQFLKQTSSFFQPSQYTSGKSSSAAGLTAAVTRDHDSKEFTIEAGALMLSDKGICCIDEFDKMSYKDQVSIHEGMEQQTVTIAKAGINCTLNCRASILGAANPIKGRYNVKKPLRHNINLSLPLMSRFDLYFVLIDKHNEEQDREIGRYIVRNHQKYSSSNDFLKEQKSSEFKETNGWSVSDVLAYVWDAKHKKVSIGESAAEDLKSFYVKLREESLENKNGFSVTVRHLESLIRLSEALAKLHNLPEVNTNCVEEAYRLIKSSFVEVKRDMVLLDLETITGERRKEECGLEVDSKEYERIVKVLVYLIKIGEWSKEELVIKYLEYQEEMIKSVDEFEGQKTLVSKVIDFLITKEGILYVVDNVVCVHPNYDC